LLIERLEKLLPLATGEHVRPRAFYYDDKHGHFFAFVDYLVPRGLKASRTPEQFNSELRDGVAMEGRHSGPALGLCTFWDVRIKEAAPESDHFDIDHARYYSGKNVGDFTSGTTRGSTIGDLDHDWEPMRYHDQWNIERP